MVHTWTIVPGSLSADSRRAQVRCERTGLVVPRIHPFRRTVAQPDCAGLTSRSSR